MEIGTLKIKTPKTQGRRSRSGSGGGRGPGKGGGGGGDDRPNDGAGIPFESFDLSSHKIRIVTWFLLMVVLMTFAGVIAAYIMISTNGVAEWTPFKLPVQLWVSTALIMASSITYAVSHSARRAGNHAKARTFLLATTVLGGVFISSQILAWLELVRRGYYLQSNPYAGFFYFMTFLHALHVLGGIVALGYALLRTWEPARSEQEVERRLEVSKAVGNYWHFMDGLWLVIVLMLGFWK